MTVRIGWDEYEVALLIDACNRIRDNKIDKAECVHKLSNLLRQRAKANGINIDEVFRNENGIALQMTKMEYLLTDGKKGLPGASKLYIEMAKMSKLNSDEFEKILILAKEQIGYKEAMNNMNTREKFIQWLSSNPISKYSSNTIVNALDEGSEYCCSRSLSKVSFWDMNNKNEFITVASKLLGMKIYRLMHKKTAIVLDKAVPLYKKFLQQSEKRSGIKIPDVEISTEGSGDNVEAKDNQSSDSKYSQIYQKLYYISKVYDDPNGMTLEKIMSMLGNGTDEKLVISILNDVSWATKLADDIYSFGKNANSVLREQVQPYKIEEKDIVTDGQFFDFLCNYEKMAEASCRSYVSAIRTAEEYAKNHNYASHMIYDCGFEDASTLIRVLMGDNEFLEFNAKQHNRFRAAFKKYLKMGGQLPAKERKSLSVKKISLPVAKEIEKVQPKDFDKSKFEITLLRRYRNGMQFDSIDFENFREMYDALFDETLTFDDEALEERLRYCGVLYKDRLFPAEGIIDNNTKETLFAYIDNCFSTGKSVLYYKAIYQDLSDAFASCFTLADEKMLKAYIEYSAEKDKYYYFSDYMSVDRNVKIDHTEEIEEYFLSAGKPMRLDDVFSTLSHKKGNRRAGCLVCPRAAERNEYMARVCYPNEFDSLMNNIREVYAHNFQSEKKLDEFIRNGGWKARKNGRDLPFELNYKEKSDARSFYIIIDNPKTDWRQWIKTIGVIKNDRSPYIIDFRGDEYKFEVKENDKHIELKSTKDMSFMAGSNLRTTIEFTGALKLRYSLAYATLSDFDSEIKKANNPSATNNKLYAVATIGRDSAESGALKKKIENFFVNNPESNAIVIDSSTCVLGEGEYNEFVENYAMSLAIGNSDLDQRKTYEGWILLLFIPLKVNTLWQAVSLSYLS